MNEDPILSGVPRVQGHPLLPPCLLYDLIGHGGMGSVYRARHLRLDLDVAVKVMRPDLAGQPGEWVKRFQREAALAARVSHQNLVRVYDVLGWRHLSYLVMEAIEGENCRQLVERRGALPIGEAVAIARDAAAGLAAAHTAGIVHRDVKPDNLLLSTKGEVKLADLGLAKAFDGPVVGTEATLLTATMGTPQYMAPEQWEDTRGVGPSADVFALGATLYFLLTGTDARPRGRLRDLMRQALSEELPDVRELRDDVSTELAGLLRRATALDAKKRLVDASELLAALQSVSTGGAAHTPAAEVAVRTGEQLQAPSAQAIASAHALLDRLDSPTELEGQVIAERGNISAGSDRPDSPPQDAVARPKRPRSTRRTLLTLVALFVLAGALFGPDAVTWAETSYRQRSRSPFDGAKFTAALQQLDFDEVKGWLKGYDPQDNREMATLQDLRAYTLNLEALATELAEWERRPRGSEVASRKEELLEISLSANTGRKEIPASLARRIDAGFREMEALSPWFGVPPSAEPASRYAEAERNSRETFLATLIDVDWRAVTVEAALRDLADKTGVELVMNWPAERADELSDLHVTVLGSLTTARALELLDVDQPFWHFKGGALFVSPAMAIDAVLPDGVRYDIRPLLDHDPFLSRTLEDLGARSPANHLSASNDLPDAYSRNSVTTRFSSELDRQSVLVADDILNLVRENVAKDDWDLSDDFNIDFTDDNSLLVIHEPRVQKQVAAFLTRLLFMTEESERRVRTGHLEHAEAAVQRWFGRTSNPMSPEDLAIETGFPLVAIDIPPDQVQGVLSQKCIETRTRLDGRSTLSMSESLEFAVRVGSDLIEVAPQDSLTARTLVFTHYDVSEHVRPHRRHPNNKLGLVTDLQWARREINKRILSSGVEEDTFVGGTWDDGPSPIFSEDTLVSLIRDYIYPDNWSDDPERSITSTPSRLTVTTDAGAHRAIRRLLEQLVPQGG